MKVLAFQTPAVFGYFAIGKGESSLSPFDESLVCLEESPVVKRLNLLACVSSRQCLREGSYLLERLFSCLKLLTSTPFSMLAGMAGGSWRGHVELAGRHASASG